MTEISVDLTKQEYQAFDPKQHDVKLKNINFIYGKNGSGKSTLCRLIMSQYENEYEVKIFDGANSVLKEEKLNAVILGDTNNKIAKEIEVIDNKMEVLVSSKKDIENKIKKILWKDEYREIGLEPDCLFTKKENLEKQYNMQSKKIEKYCVSRAKDIKDLGNTKLFKFNYNKTDFESDIKNANLLEDEVVKKYEGIIKEDMKPNVNYSIDENIDFQKTSEDVRTLLEQSVVSYVNVDDFDKNNDKRLFAQKGLELHQIGEKCSFCGSELTTSRFSMLEKYFKGQDILDFQRELESEKSKLVKKIEEINTIELLNEKLFSIQYRKDVEEVNNLINKYKIISNQELKKYINAIDSKKSNIFEEKIIEYNYSIDEYNLMQSKLEILLKNQNTLNENYEKELEKAKFALKNHYVKVALNKPQPNWKGYDIEKNTLENVNFELKVVKETISDQIGILSGDKMSEVCSLKSIENDEKILKQLRLELISKSENTEILANRITKILNNAGIKNIKLVLVKEDSHDTVEHYQIEDDFGIRPINKVSTGEMNLISFLYFMESLEVRESDSPRILIFDDPMNSNDENMQYLIITKIQKLYQNKYRKKFNKDKDILICLSHNIHFYLNVRPNSIDEKCKNPDNPEGPLIKKTKYDKANYYIFNKGEIRKITSKKEDINTLYESLWLELGTLYELNLINSMLNSMRRILETYMHFNKIEGNKFYNNLEVQNKMFNVNSHAIDDPSIDNIGKSKEEILSLFKEVFEKNKAIDHYNAYQNHWNSN